MEFLISSLNRKKIMQQKLTRFTLAAYHKVQIPQKNKISKFSKIIYHSIVIENKTNVFSECTIRCLWNCTWRTSECVQLDSPLQKGSGAGNGSLYVENAYSISFCLPRAQIMLNILNRQKLIHPTLVYHCEDTT